MLKRLPTAPIQVKTRNTAENVLTEIRQIIYSLYRAREITKAVYKKYNTFNKVIKQNEYYINEF